MPPSVIQRYSEDIEKAKVSYEENKSLPDRIKKIEREIEELKEEKDSLEWNVNPVLKNLEQSQKREAERIVELDDQIKKLQR